MDRNSSLLRSLSFLGCFVFTRPSAPEANLLSVAAEEFHRRDPAASGGYLARTAVILPASMGRLHVVLYAFNTSGS